MQKMKLDLLTPYTSINSKCIKYFNVRLKTVKIQEENIGSKISEVSRSNIFSDMSLQVRETNKKRGCIKLKSFCAAKETINKMKTQPTEWENMFTNDTCDKGQISKTYKEYMKFNTKTKQSNLKTGRGPE